VSSNSLVLLSIVMF